MIPMKNYLFQTPEDICVQLKKMTHPVTIRTTDIANFWHYLESATLPVITKAPLQKIGRLHFCGAQRKHCKAYIFA